MSRIILIFFVTLAFQQYTHRLNVIKVNKIFQKIRLVRKTRLMTPLLPVESPPTPMMRPIGYDSIHWVSVKDVLNYTILFENDPSLLRLE